MNFRNEKYYAYQLTQRIKVVSYGNFHIVGVLGNSITVNACYPRMQDLASVYMMFSKLKDDLETLRLPYKFSIERGIPTIYINPQGWDITIRRFDKDYQLLIKRVYVGAYGVLLYRTLFDSRASTINNICLTIRNYLQ